MPEFTERVRERHQAELAKHADRLSGPGSMVWKIIRQAADECGEQGRCHTALHRDGQDYEWLESFRLNSGRANCHLPFYDYKMYGITTGHYAVPDHRKRLDFKLWCDVVLPGKTSSDGHGNCYETNTALFWKLVKEGRPNLKLCIFETVGGYDHCVVLDGSIMIDHSQHQTRELALDEYMGMTHKGGLNIKHDPEQAWAHYSCWGANDKDCPKTGYETRMLVDTAAQMRVWGPLVMLRRGKYKYKVRGGPPTGKKSWTEFICMMKIPKMEYTEIPEMTPEELDDHLWSGPH
jgi:hypothetical protein